MAIKEVKRKSKKVKEAEIEAKDQRWHCRNRVTLVFGFYHPLLKHNTRTFIENA